MTLSEARNILGLKPDEDPRPHLPGLRLAREKIAEMVRTAPTEAIALRYQDNLVEFDRALAVIREHLESPPKEIPPEVAPIITPIAPEPETSAAADGGSTKSKRSLAPFVCLFLVLIAAAAGGLFYLKHLDEQEQLLREKVTRLNREGASYIENRRWADATEIYQQIETLEPDSKLVPIGRRSIEAGMLEEQKQFIGYWNGQAIAFFEADRWDDAESAARQILETYPDESEAAAMLEKISAARLAEERRQVLVEGRKQLEQRHWELAIQSAQSVLSEQPEDAEAKKLLADATAAQEKARINAAKARELFSLATQKDHGAYDQEILDLLREARALAPEDQEVATFLERMSSYSRTLRVPSEFSNPADALKQARDRDRVVIDEGTWKGPWIVNTAVELQGSGAETTIVECAGDESAAITLGPGANGARITGFTFRHNTVEAGDERYSAALVRGGEGDFADCKFQEASGHGLLVMEGGHAVVSRCKFTANGWDGIAVSGQGSLLEVKECEASANYGHGIESWDGAAMILTDNHCSNNSHNGVHASNGQSSVTMIGNELDGNREFGLVLDSAGSGRVVSNIMKGNLLGGLVVREAASGVRVAGNQALSNLGPGIVLEHGLGQEPYGTNISIENQGEAILTNANLSPNEEPPAKVPAADSSPE
ncbi:right-handed parallel beta-helix repeat-containing protein [Luteolibacter pohnpeiensis]|uniref:Right-handed parallel beta-helix repeat-containing protein n=1 Tax=Luteolibacter pohnpeiensis TaxID=454153 RepID=A0A934S6Z7_9BACT|nr:right-handed parallel beta-helix repeat-containing protein [Luteolibacter pohnpeiensis]MBK1880872.1 right-handed parallel beta-helix repeat-containing protein [Luteolibacter pohnpeiensis]